MDVDCAAPDVKKQRHRGSESDDKSNARDNGGELTGGLGHLPSKEAMASKGLEAKVEMATHGYRSWALTSLGSWRNQSLRPSGDDRESAEFIKSRQREARRAMLGSRMSVAVEAGAAETAPAGGGGDSFAERPFAEAVPKKPPGRERPTDMAVG